ncbi:MAG: alkyl sulfatase dimerization domain-containing protein [Solirubrobacteraceae bacterium]
MSGPADASDHTRALHASALEQLPAEDREDFEDAARGRIASEGSLVLRGENGQVVWNMDSYSFLKDGAESPETVHPSLWRHSVLNMFHGLFEVVPGIYQVRGYDVSNVTFLEGATGVIVIDPLVSAECAAAALALYRRHRGDRPVTGVIYSHTHVDHWGGVKGVVAQESVKAGEVPIWAPAGFMEFAISENVLAGAAMVRRAEYMFAPALARGPRGQVDAGMGKTASTGTVTLIPPTHEVTATGQDAQIDGVRFVFQLVPDSEAPVEMNFHFPEKRVLCIPENATHCMHNLLTPRGAQVRDALRWSKYMGEAIEMFGADSDALFAQHNWPRWGTGRITDFLARHRDMYRYLHDQTLRLANKGLTSTEIAAEVTMPPSLAGTWSCRGLYGSTSFNVRAVYQRYLGFFDGNPAHLDPLAPEEAAKRYVELAGGLDELLAKARSAFERGEYRWVGELASHAVFTEPGSAPARELLADALEQLGYQSESAPSRNFYLVGAHELREGAPERDGGRRVASLDVARSLPLEKLWDGMGASLDGPRAWDASILISWDFTDVGERWTVRVENGALSTVEGKLDPAAQAKVVLTRAAFDAVILKEGDVGELFASGAIAVEGDAVKLAELFGLVDEADAAFAIVTP